ncbi:MAG: hypothetical protein R3B13_29185 [Polyangiaceae bacterium]
MGAFETVNARRADQRALIALRHGHFDDEYDPIGGAAKGRVADMVSLVVLVKGDSSATLELYRGLVDGDPYYFPTKALTSQRQRRP